MKTIFSILLAAIIPVLMLSTGGSVYAQEEQNATSTSEPRFLFIQHAKSGSISELNATTHALELNGVSDKTILFSERPDRIVTSVSTSDFIGNWSAGQDSFASDPPNAALVVISDIADEEDTTLVEILNPTYDTDTKTLQYDAIALNGSGIDIPSQFGEATLIIDWGGDCAGAPPPC